MLYYKMNTLTIVIYFVLFLLGILIFHMIKNVCGCKNVVEGNEHNEQNQCNGSIVPYHDPFASPIEYGYCSDFSGEQTKCEQSYQSVRAPKSPGSNPAADPHEYRQCLFMTGNTPSCTPDLEKTCFAPSPLEKVQALFTPDARAALKNLFTHHPTASGGGFFGDGTPNSKCPELDDLGLLEAAGGSGIAQWQAKETAAKICWDDADRYTDQQRTECATKLLEHLGIGLTGSAMWNLSQAIATNGWKEGIEFIMENQPEIAASVTAMGLTKVYNPYASLIMCMNDPDNFEKNKDSQEVRLWVGAAAGDFGQGGISPDRRREIDEASDVTSFLFGLKDSTAGDN